MMIADGGGGEQGRPRIGWAVCAAGLTSAAGRPGRWARGLPGDVAGARAARRGAARGGRRRRAAGLWRRRCPRGRWWAGCRFRRGGSFRCRACPGHSGRWDAGRPSRRRCRDLRRGHSDEARPGPPRRDWSRGSSCPGCGRRSGPPARMGMSSVWPTTWTSLRAISGMLRILATGRGPAWPAV